MRLIGADGEKLGIVALEQALAMAEENELDLVEVAPQAEPPVCRVMDFNKLQYERQRKVKESRKHARHIEIKEVKLRPAVGQHDYETKLNRARNFLLKGCKVKATLMFRQRELRRYEVGRAVINQLVKDLGDIATSEPGQRTHARTLTILLSPTKEVADAAQVEAEKKADNRPKHKVHEHKHDIKLRERETEQQAPQPTETQDEADAQPPEPSAAPAGE